MKKFLVTIAVLGFAFSAQADHEYEVQISGAIVGMAGIGNVGGTSGGIQINDDFGDNSPWSLGGEIYKPINANMQVGGILSFGDSDNTGFETFYTLGVMARYNLDTDLRDSMFLGLGLTYGDLGVEIADSTRIAILVSMGKRYALSDTITWTPNITAEFGIGGDTGFDEDSRIAINLISFSGFM